MSHKSFKILDGINSTIGELTNIEIEIPDFAKKIFSKNPSQSTTTSPNLLKADSDRPRFIKKEDEGDSESSGGGGSSTAAAAASLFMSGEKDNDENDGEDSGIYKKKHGIPVQDDEFM